jgi:hypothetical protein
MAATAQDSTVPLRGGDGKVKEDDLEDGTTWKPTAYRNMDVPFLRAAVVVCTLRSVRVCCSNSVVLQSSILPSMA